MDTRQTAGGNRLSNIGLVTLAAFLLIAAIACLSVTGMTSNLQETEAANTYAAEALIARMTIQAGQAAILQLTELAQEQKLVRTQTSQVNLPIIQVPPDIDTPRAPTSSPVPLIPTPIDIQTPCNQAAFISDIGLPSGTQILVGSNINKGWRIMNTGSCTWGRDYTLVYTGGNLPESPPALFMPAPVLPGGTTDLQITFQSPNFSGSFQALFLLRDPAGTTFGHGPEANTPLEFRFSTIQGSSNSTSTYDLSANFCSAAWRSTSGRLPCPGVSQDAQGSIQMVQSPLVEGLSRPGSGLWTRPDSSANGSISGLFPVFPVQSGDVFVSEIGCLQDSPNCSLTFRLEYQSSDGQSGTFGVWNEINDGRTTPIEIDLSSLAGRNVRLNLQVTNRGSWQAANGYWHQPRIQRSTSSTDLVLTWNRSTSSQSGQCRELRIRMSSYSFGTAQAFSCRDDLLDLGTRSLATDEVQQVQSWLQRFGKIEVEMYSAAQADPVIIWVKLDGTGSGNANEADIRAIDSFCNTLYNSIIR